MARQRTVDESGVTDCVSALVFVLLLSCSLCCLIVFLSLLSSLLVAVLFQFGCCRSVALLFVLLFSIVFVVDLFGVAVRMLLFCWSFGSRVSVGLVWRGLVVERRL